MLLTKTFFPLGGIGRPAPIFFWHFTPRRTQFTPKITQYIPFLTRFNHFLLKKTVMKYLVGCPMQNLKIKQEKIMKKSWMVFFIGPLLVVGSLALSARAQDSVYAVEFNQANNLFGTLDLLTGSFTQVGSSLGGTIYNDVAYNPANGTVYGIANNCVDLVTFNTMDGTVNEVAPFSGSNLPSGGSGIESIAFQPGTGELFGCAQNGLYTIDPSTGVATFVGSFGSPYNLNLMQNIRFDSDGNLYLGNTSDNTDIYQVNTQTGSATFMGEVAGYADLDLMNAGQYMYGVSVPAMNGATAQPVLVSFDLTSFVNGGTNADGSIHQIGVTMVGGGPPSR